MSIRLRDVRVTTSFNGDSSPLFDGIDLCVENGAHVGILGIPKSGKSTLLRLMCGTEAADSGLIDRTSQISWPIPLNSFFATKSTLAVNIRFIARLYGIADESFPRRIVEMVELAEFLNVPLEKCPKFVKPRLALAMGIGMEFDVYLFDGSIASPADKEFKEKAAELVVSRTADRACVLATSQLSEVERFCDSIYVLEAGQARHFSQVKEATEYFKELLAKEKQRQDKRAEAERPAEETEADGSGDIDVIGTAIASAIE